VLSRLPLNPLVEGCDSPTLLITSLDLFLEKNLSNVICLCLLFKILRKCCMTLSSNRLMHPFTTATLGCYFSTRFCVLDQYPNNSLMSAVVMLPSLFFSSSEDNSSATSCCCSLWRSWLTDPQGWAKFFPSRSHRSVRNLAPSFVYNPQRVENIEMVFLKIR